MLHWPTAIAASAFACGQMALMSRESSTAENGVIDSARVATLIHDGDVPTRTIWGYSAEIAKQAFGIDAEALPTYRATVLRLGTRLLAGSYPALDVPLHLVPHETPANAGPRLRRSVHEIAEAHGISGDDIAFALATATMKMVGSVQHLGVRDLTSLAMQCYVAGSRFAPMAECAVDPALSIAPADPAGSLPGTVSEKEEAVVSVPPETASQAMADITQGGFGKRR